MGSRPILGAAPPWVKGFCEPTRLVDCLDMRLYGMRAIGVIESLVCEEAAVRKGVRNNLEIELCLASAVSLCQDYGFIPTWRFAEPMWRRIKDGVTYDDKILSNDLEELRSRLNDELKSRLFLYVPRTALYCDPLIGWEAVLLAFPDSQFDIGEAGRCLAVERFTAAAFHLHRAVEPVSAAMAVKMQLGTCKNWGQYLAKLGKILDSNPLPKIPGIKWSRDKSFYDQLRSDIAAMKGPRNTGTHDVQKQYGEGEAVSLYQHVQTFMAHTAPRVGKKKRKGSP